MTCKIAATGEAFPARAAGEGLDRRLGDWLLRRHRLDRLVPGAWQNGRGLILGLIVRCDTCGRHTGQRHWCEVVLGLKHGGWRGI